MCPANMQHLLQLNFINQVNATHLSYCSLTFLKFLYMSVADTLWFYDHKVSFLAKFECIGSSKKTIPNITRLKRF